MEAAPAPEPQRGGNPIPAIIAGGAIGKAIAVKGKLYRDSLKISAKINNRLLFAL
jgi:hypothetical protein